MCATEVSMAMGRRGLQAEVTQRVARGRVGRDHLVEVVKLLLVALSSEKLRSSGRKALMRALKAMPFCRGVCMVVRWLGKS